MEEEVEKMKGEEGQSSRQAFCSLFLNRSRLNIHLPIH